MIYCRDAKKAILPIRPSHTLRLISKATTWRVWFALSYDDFLNRVITLAAAVHYGFNVNDLKERKGLKQFFGFKD